MTREVDVIKAQLRRNYVTALEGDAHFADPHTIEIVNEDGVQQVRGEKILIACGTRPAHIDGIPVDGKRIFDSDQVHCLEEIPRELIVVGAGIIGLEYASMFAALGVKVTLLDQRPTLLDFVDREIIESLCFQLRQLGTVFRVGEKVVSVGFDEERDKVFAALESGKKVRGQALLYTIGRQSQQRQAENRSGRFDSGRARQAGGERTFSDGCAAYLRGGRRDWVSGAGQHFDGAGAAGGLPYVRQAQQVAAESDSLWHLHDSGNFDGGRDRGRADAQPTPYESGLARYSELAKGQMLGDDQGLLKILFDPDTLKLLGVHIIGDRAAEIVHIGQAVLTMGATIEYFRDTVFNYPTLAEAYKVAALDGLNKL
jgi:NAD(P) transhydrogenase